jgi:16S rRNA (guanine1207-N2)-methyltransferase
MAILNPDIELEMCDISALAVESSKATLAANGLNGRVFASDVYSDCANNYRFIISNPPFHAGLNTSYSATETLLADAPKQLSTSGELIIVANSFLKYPPIIERAFGKCATLNKTNKFCIYHAQR